jgi:hypothetical protein
MGCKLTYAKLKSYVTAVENDTLLEHFCFCVSVVALGTGFNRENAGISNTCNSGTKTDLMMMLVLQYNHKFKHFHLHKLYVPPNSSYQTAALVIYFVQQYNVY